MAVHKFWVFMLHKVAGPGSDDKIKYKRIDWAHQAWPTTEPTEIIKANATEWTTLRTAIAAGEPCVFSNDVGQQFHIPANSVIVHFLGYEDEPE